MSKWFAFGGVFGLVLVWAFIANAQEPSRLFVATGAGLTDQSQWNMNVSVVAPVYEITSGFEAVVAAGPSLFQTEGVVNSVSWQSGVGVSVDRMITWVAGYDGKANDWMTAVLVNPLALPGLE